MFNKLKIDNFRGIRTSEISNFSQVNLFFGKNNCGKSTVLEAIFLITGQSNPILPFNVNSFRGFSSFEESDLSIDFYNQKEDKISISTEGDISRSLEITPFHSHENNVSLSQLEQSVNQQLPTSYGLIMKYKLGSDSYSSRIVITKKEAAEGRIHRDNRYKESLFAEYLPASYNQVHVTNQYAKIVEEKQESTIVNILRTIEPKIRDMQLVGENLLVDVGLERRLPINVMGDGIRKLVSIILSIYRCRNGILLIDEIDNGFHHSVLPQLWKAVFMAASINNTQVFITTHNLESMKEMIHMLRKEENSSYQSMLSAYKLLKDKTDKVIGVQYQFEQMDYSIEQEIEMR